MREIFHRTILSDGRIGLSIDTPKDRAQNNAGTNLLPEGVTLTQKDLTPLLLHMLAEAYHSGYCEAVADAAESVSRLIYENNAPRKPAPKISETLDYRKGQEGGGS